MVWVGTHRGPRAVRVGETHMLLLIALVFGLMGFRLGLNNQDSNVIDVGYAGVAGASRLMDGVLPYGHMPDKTSQAVRREVLERRPEGLHPVERANASRRSARATPTGRPST